MKKFKLGELIDICNGTNYSHLGKGDIPVYGSGGIMCYVDSFLYEGEAILLPRKGTLNNIMYVNGKIWTVDTMYYATVNEKAVPYYLYRYLSILDLAHLDSGSTLPSMTKGSYNNLEIVLPDVTTQRRIAAVLSVLDTKIELNNRINAELEAMAKTLYDYWFVQFDFPDTNGKPYKSSGGKMVYSEELKREIPAGWEVKKIKDIAQTGSGGTPLSTTKEYYEGGDIAWINSGEVNQPFIVSAEKYITQKGLDNSSAKIFPRGTILMAMYGATAGKVSLIDLEASTNQAICAIMPTNISTRYFIKFSLETIYKYLVNLSSGSARDNLSQDKIRDLSFPISSDEILMKFDHTVKSIFEKILLNLKENQQLASVRDWLLPMLMNGQVTLKDAAEKAYEVTGDKVDVAAETEK